MSIIVIGIDLAKNIFAVRGGNENGHAEMVQSRGHASNMTVCSFAVLHLLTQLAQRDRNQMRNEL